jgi:hypothetical protein
MKKQILPAKLYVKIESAKDEQYFIASDDIATLGIEIGDRIKVGIYSLTKTCDAEGVIELNGPNK